MSGRISKRSVLSDRKRNERIALLASFDESVSQSADMPCTRCFRQDWPCVMAEGVSRCRRCVNDKKSCDGVLVASSREFFCPLFGLALITL